MTASRRHTWTTREVALLRELAHEAIGMGESPVKYASIRLSLDAGAVRSKMLHEGIPTASPEYHRSHEIYVTHEIAVRHELCVWCGHNYIVKGDLGYPHGVCEPCWRKARAEYINRDESIKDATRVENAAKKARERRVKTGKSGAQMRTWEDMDNDL